MNMTAGDAHGARIESAAYVDTFFRELSPVWLSYVAALHGLQACPLDRHFTYMELGCGLAQSTVVNAGAYPAGEFHACDFNPSHIDAGRAYAAAIGVGNVEFHQSSFEELTSRDLPQFDFIVLHGVYSWVGPAARQSIRRFIQQRLKANGLVYVSYNCMPGWAVESPLRRLLVELAAGETGTMAQKAERALRKLQALNDAKLGYFNVNAAAEGAVSAYSKQSLEYLVHEFFAESWQPFYSVDVTDEMGEVGLRYAGSATLVDNHDALTMESRVMSAVAGLETDRQRRLAADFAMNRYFRRDVFASQNAAPDGRRLGSVIVGRIDAAAPLPPQIRVPRGVISFQRVFVDELRELMSRRSMSIDDIVAEMRGGGERGAAEIVRNLTFLVAAGALTPFARVHTYAERTGRPRPASATVKKMLEYAVEHRSARVLPSETLGNGVEIAFLEALAILEVLAGVDRPDQLSGRLLEEVRRGLGQGSEDVQAQDPAARADSVARTAVYDLWPKLVRLGIFT
jgi:trans-aconitate methyltransferase